MSLIKSKYYRLSVFMILTILSGLFVYNTAINRVIYAILHSEGSGHGVFIPFLLLYFLWIKRNDLKIFKPEYNLMGIVFVLIGLFFSISKLFTFHLQFIGFIIFLAGLVYVLFGKEVFRITLFPIFFLITMIPIPSNFNNSLASIIRHISFVGSTKIISLLGISYVKEGWLIQLPNVVLEVTTGCSGIRYLISFVVFGIAYAWLYRDTLKGRLLIVALTIPVSIFANICRLTIIYIMVYNFGSYMAEPQPHNIIGRIVFFVVLIACVAADHHFQKRRYVTKLRRQEARMMGG